MRYAVTAETMKKCEAAAIGKGVDSIILMKRASDFLLANIDIFLKTAIICGGGNNGGDGISLACDLAKLNNFVTLIMLSSPKTDSSKFYFDIAKSTGVKIVEYNDKLIFDEFDQLVDCIFGVGLNKEPAGIYAEVIDKINSSGKIVISADIPSGLNADNGLASRHTVKADKTVSFGAYKTGHFLNDAKDYTGILVNNDIGIELSEKYEIYDAVDFKRFFPKKKENSYKYNNGKLTVIGGSKNYVGAVMLAGQAEAALRAGAGLACIAVPDFLIDSVRSRIIDQTLCPLSDNGETLVFNGRETDEALQKANAVVVGIGIGRGEEIEKLIDYLLGLDIALLIDADGISALTNIKKRLKNKKARVIVTPHTAEFSRLSGVCVEDIIKKPIEYAQAFAKEYSVTILLKGAATVISDGYRTALSPYGNSGLSVGGSGDVLSGIIGGLLARHTDAYNACVLGSFLLGRAGEKLSEKLTCYGIVASDIPKAVPYVIKEIMDIKNDNK